MRSRPSTSEREPCRAEIDALTEPAVIEFGASWCGYCRAAQPLIALARSSHPRVQWITIEDGPGRVLGRSYRVKRWPTLIFLARGQEVARLVRPAGAAEIERALTAIDLADQPSAAERPQATPGQTRHPPASAQ